MSPIEQKYVRICLKTLNSLTSRALMRDIQDIGKAPEDSFEMVHSELLDELEAINDEV